jgi:Amt family ammonium transporter
MLGLISGPLFLASEKLFSRAKWFSDPVGLFPGHMLGGIFGFTMIAFFTQQSCAASAGSANARANGILFGGGTVAVQQLGWHILATLAVMVTVFVLSFITTWLISLSLHGITRDYEIEAD